MKIVQPTFKVVDSNKVLRNIELGARTCYKSEDKIGPGSDVAIIEKILTPKHGVKHESVLEHGVITVKLVFDRGVSHEFVRHRHTSPSQESTRYCNYGKGKFGGQITVVDLATGFGYDLSNPVDAAKYEVWQRAMADAETHYLRLLELGASAQEARSVLPNSTKTEMVVTANVREWRLILALRTNRDAHPQIRQVMVALGKSLAKRWPVLFNEFATAEHPSPAIETEEENEDAFRVC